jgi:drug/metabolite transporter (DMT)-like permease
MTDPDQRRLYWRICYLTVVVLSILVFTPLVIPAGTYRPMVGGVPYTLWVGILITFALLVLTYYATQYYPPADDGPAGLKQHSSDSATNPE